MQDEIVIRLRDIQDTLAEDDGTFARRLGIHRTTWVKIRNGDRRPGTAFLGGVRRAFPKMADQVTAFLVAENVANTTSRGDDSHAEAAS